MQQAGAALDTSTDGRWVAEALSRMIEGEDIPGLIVVDSTRTSNQIGHLRAAFGPRRILHVHVTASENVCATRYQERRSDGDVTWEEAKSDPTEQAVHNLAKEADVLIDTDQIGVEDVVVRVAARLGLLAKGHAPRVDVLVGGLYGSEGKGNIAFYLAPEYDLLVRVGGPNAGHKVFLGTGEVFTHHHLPSGTQAGNDAPLLLAPGCVLLVPDLLDEIAACGVEADRLAIDPGAMVIDEEDRRTEKVLERTIGSTARGVGAATARRVMRGALEPPVVRAGDVRDLAPYIRPASDVLEDAYRRGERVLVEGTQGTGLSLYHGSYPYVTSRDTSVAACLSEAGIPPSRVRRSVMVCRTLPIRVQNPAGGTSGPLKYETTWEAVEQNAGFPAGHLADREKTSTTNRERRVGEFEWDLLRKAALINGPSDIALTFTDYIAEQNGRARRFEQLTPETIRFIDEVETVASAPVSLISVGFDERCILDRRNW